MAQPASSKPSLIDDMPASGGPGTESGESIRMLDALGSSRRPAPRVAARRGFGLLLAGIMLLAACGAGWSWWNQRNNVDDDADRATNVGAGPSTAPVKPGPTTATATLPPTAASAVGAAAAPAPGATIIAMPDAAMPSSVGSAAVSTPPAAASQPAPAAEATRVATAGPAKTKPKAANPALETRSAAEANADRKRALPSPSTPNRRTATPTPTPTSIDPDVALLSAMLATMSRDGNTAPNSNPSAQTQLTIAQLVQRCNVRGIKDAIETFECRRRICDGYWGKAEACPKSLSPKKN